MRPDSYRRIARLLRHTADRIEACAERQDAQERRTLTMLLHSLSRQTRDWSDRHRATVYGSHEMPHYMLPNDHHPGPRCSCRDCFSAYPG